MAITIVNNSIAAKGNKEVAITPLLLQATSEGIADPSILFTVGSLPSQGELRLNGLAVGVNKTFTQADINAGRLTYLPTGTGAKADGFSFTVTDGTTTTGTPATLPKVIFDPIFQTNPGSRGVFDNPVFSANGRYILAGGDTISIGAIQRQLGLYLYDLQTTTIERIAVQSSNPNANTPFARNFDISGDGRYITFDSLDGNLAVGDTDPALDVFVFDRQTGVNKLISVGSKGEKNAFDSKLPTISSDGRYIAFESPAPYLIANDNTIRFGSSIFVYDVQTTAIERVSQGFPTGGASSSAISANGRYVVFNSNAGLTPDDLGKDRVYVRDRQTGSLETVSVNSSGVAANQASGDYLNRGRSAAATISGDGRYVAFTSIATNLVAGDTNDVSDIFVRDRQTGTTQRVSLDTDGNQIGVQNIRFGVSGFYTNLQLSEDGRYLSFNSNYQNLVAGDTIGTSGGAFIRDLQTGTNTRLANYNRVNDGNIFTEQGPVAISRDARYVAYRNYVRAAQNGVADKLNLFFTDRGSAGGINLASGSAAITINTASSPLLNSPITRFQNTDVAGAYIFASGSEATNIRTNFKNFKEEGLAFQVAVEKSDPLMQPLYRFQNSSVPGTYLFAGESEAANIRINFKNFKEEGLAFYGYGVGAGQGATLNRFQNSSLPGTYLFAGAEETRSILANNKNFILEGAAFEIGG
jgi:hypothetical protein